MKKTKKNQKEDDSPLILIALICCLLTIFFIMPLVPGFKEANNELLKPLGFGDKEIEIKSSCLSMNGTYNNKRCDIGERDNTKYSWGMSCNGYTIVIHHNDTVEVELPKKAKEECFIIKENRSTH